MHLLSAALKRWNASALTQRGHPLDVLINVAL
jgi:hypothetical protein